MSDKTQRKAADKSPTANELRRRYLSGAKRVVLKVGSSLLAESPIGQPAAIADELARLDSSIELVVVSSGAIALGLPALGLRERPSDLPRLQAAAAIGQRRLVQNWEHAFDVHNRHIAQLLLTNGIINRPDRYANAQNALASLIDSRIIPVINENDTVATDEITFGDNDELAALVCKIVHADALLIYTDVNGLHDCDPAQGGKRISFVSDIESQARPYASPDSASGLGRGGMASKVSSAAKATGYGVPTVIVPGRERNILTRTLACEDVGTLFAPKS